MKELLVLAKDRIGLLADLSGALGLADINVESISADTMGDRAVIHLVVSDDKRGKEILEKKGFIVMSSDAIVVKVIDRPGELAKVAKILADAKVSVKNVQLLTKEGGLALFVFRVDNADKATKLLKDYV
ncbi:MAG: ACT domain-containing protein [Candidatus Micrarchaeota archaeon]|nr:ACT domain-containing protein [Candidatus Micrarchaeota archaeon]